MDKILSMRLVEEKKQAFALAEESEFLAIRHVDPQRFVASFNCPTLVRGRDRVVREVVGFEVGYWFSDTYLRHVEDRDVLSWLGPVEIFHPNVNPPLCCIGTIAPGTSLVDLIYRTYDVISYQNVMPAENDALNLAACQWARNNQHRFPIDDRPLKRRSGDRRGAAPELRS